ncbi:transposase [Streptomyces sp. NPDC057136]|uniref:transposase n=1 Tax=Streptomyces sp. NPDC057136 TaxID=3346029 RepID=UPI0036332743
MSLRGGPGAPLAPVCHGPPPPSFDIEVRGCLTWRVDDAAWCCLVRADLSHRLVPDELWELAAPLLPRFTSRPQGGGTGPVDERAVFAAVVYVLTSGCAWRYLPESFGVSPATAHRRFTVLDPHRWLELRRFCGLYETGTT